MHTAIVVNNIYEEFAMNTTFVSATITGGVLVALVSNAFAEDYKRASLDAPAGVQSVQGQDLLPPNAQPGECYARLYVPPQYETFETKVLKTYASQTLAIQPAEFENVTEGLKRDWKLSLRILNLKKFLPDSIQYLRKLSTSLPEPFGKKVEVRLRRFKTELVRLCVW